MIKLTDKLAHDFSAKMCHCEPYPIKYQGNVYYTVTEPFYDGVVKSAYGETFVVGGGYKATLIKVGDEEDEYGNIPEYEGHWSITNREALKNGYEENACDWDSPDYIEESGAMDVDVIKRLLN